MIRDKDMYHWMLYTVLHFRILHYFILYFIVYIIIELNDQDMKRDEAWNYDCHLQSNNFSWRNSYPNDIKLIK